MLQRESLLSSGVNHLQGRLHLSWKTFRYPAYDMTGNSLLMFRAEKMIVDNHMQPVIFVWTQIDMY